MAVRFIDKAWNFLVREKHRKRRMAEALAASQSVAFSSGFSAGFGP